MRWAFRAVAALLVVGAFVALWAAGGLDVRALVAGSGRAAALVYVAAFSVLGGLLVPGLIFTIAAPVLFPPWLAFGLSMVGGFGSCVVGFGTARYLAHDWAQRHLPAKLRNLDDRLEGGGFVTAVLVRLALYIIPPTHWAFGLSRIGWGPYLLGSIVGIVPWTLGATFGTTALMHWLGDQPLWVWIVLGAVLPLGIWWRSRGFRDAEPGRDQA